MLVNQSIQMLIFVWNERRFVESKSARSAARRCIYRAANIQLRAELKNLENQNNEIRHEMNRCNHDLHKYDEKLQVLGNMTQLATQSLEVYFQARMENLRTFVTDQCRIISDGIQEEADHWKEIHAMLQQKLVVPGDLRSYGGGNGLPRGVKQSPNFSQIVEEDEEAENETAMEEEPEKRTDVSFLLQARTLTPLITQTLKKARLRASRRSHDTSAIAPPQFDTSVTMHEETVMEEPESPAKAATNHMTLRDVSAIAKETEMDADMTSSDLSMSLLPFIATSHHPDDGQHNKSTGSTISDKTFVKTSLKPFSSEEDEEEEDDADVDETMMEESLLVDSKERARPLLLTADQSIRLGNGRSSRQEKVSLPNRSSKEKPSIKQEKISFREPLKPSDPVEKQRSVKIFLSNNPTFNAEKSDYVRPTITISNDASKLSPIVSDEEEEEDDGEKQHHKPQPTHTHRKVEKKTVEDLLSTSTSANRSKTSKSPLVTQAPPPVATGSLENSNRRRTTRRTTIRSIQESQNVPPSADASGKSRYATRYSTRLAATTIKEESTTTNNRRTTRFTSE